MAQLLEGTQATHSVHPMLLLLLATYRCVGRKRVVRGDGLAGGLLEEQAWTPVPLLGLQQQQLPACGGRQAPSLAIVCKLYAVGVGCVEGRGNEVCALFCGAPMKGGWWRTLTSAEAFG